MTSKNLEWHHRAKWPPPFIFTPKITHETYISRHVCNVFSELLWLFLASTLLSMTSVSPCLLWATVFVMSGAQGAERSAFLNNGQIWVWAAGRGDDSERLMSRGVATNFWLGGTDSGESKPPTPKFRFILGFCPLYFVNIGKSKSFSKYSKIFFKNCHFWGTSPEFWNGGGNMFPASPRWRRPCLCLHTSLYGATIYKPSSQSGRPFKKSCLQPDLARLRVRLGR